MERESDDYKTKKNYKKYVCVGGISELEYLEAHGFRHGKNFQYYSGHPIDSNWPWLISVGDDVMLASDVRILAHDASTGYTGARTKIGCVSEIMFLLEPILLCYATRK